MNEIKELRFGDTDIVLKDNAVRSAVLPQTSKELARNLKIQDNVEIDGGVYGNSINIDGSNVLFRGAVYVNKDLHISNTINGKIIFKKAVASADTVGAFLNEGRAIFGSDINAQSVRLKNCYVGGSIFAQNILLENCVVLGGVFGSKQLSLRNCILGTFHCASIELSGTNYLLYPAGFSVEPISAMNDAKLYNLSLAHLGALYSGDKENPNTGKIEIDLVNDSQRTTLTEGDTTTIINSYSVSGRVLAADVINLDNLQNHFLIEAGALGSQVLKTYSLTKEDGSKSEDLTVDNIADFFFRILSGEVEIQNLNGSISFDELKKSFE